VGLAQGAFDKAVAYAEEREQFGQPIANFQAIQWMIAEMATEIEAARLMVNRAAWLRERGERSTKEAAMAKLFATDRPPLVVSSDHLGSRGPTRIHPADEAGQYPV
jgi:butyryl-CoA dehydrogenase